MAPTKKKLRFDGATPLLPTGLTALPPALVDSVLDFLAGDDFYHSNGHRYWTRKLAPLLTLAKVSTQWRDLVDAPASTRVLTTVRFKHKERDDPVTRTEMLEMRRVLILHRAFLQRLILADVPDFGNESDGVWHAALSHAPRLQLLDMDTGEFVCPLTRDVLHVTQAASRQCPQLQRLMFPSRMSRLKTRTESRPRKHHMRVFANGVLACLPAWAKHGGLRHLRLTLREQIQGRAFMRTYLDTIATHCPQIEMLDGFAATVESAGIVTCEERWNVDLAAWDRFCATCDQLTHFDWVTVPFATRFFEIFGQHCKSKLTHLTFSVSAMWMWRRYFATVDPTTKAALEATGYGSKALRAHAVLQACPNLKEVRIEWFTIPGSQHDPVFANLTGVNPDIFGDDFCEALACHCTGLTRLQLGPVPTQFTARPSASIATLTDRSFRALATLLELNWVEMIGPSITADGLFELVIHHAATTRHERVYYIVLGDDTQDSVTSLLFYDVVLGFLERLLAYEGALPCASRPVMVQLENANRSVIEEGYSAAFFNSALLMVEKLQHKYSTLQLSGLVHDYDAEYGVIKRMVEFAMATESAQLPDWTEDGDEVEVEDEEIDGGVFVSRQYYGRGFDLPGPPGSRRDGEEDEDEDDDGSQDDSQDEEDSEEGDASETEGFGAVDGDEIVFDDDDEVEFSDDDDDFISDDESDELDDSDT